MNQIKWKLNFERLKNNEKDIDISELVSRLGMVNIPTRLYRSFRSFIQRYVIGGKQ